MPTAAIGQLLARIGVGPWFVVGSQYAGQANGSGRLYLLYNERYWLDNSGSYGVTVTLGPKTTATSVLLEDNFNDPATGKLPRSSPDPTHYRLGYVNGEYQIQKVDPALDFGVGVTLPDTYSNTSLAVDIRMTGTTTNRWIGVTCRGQQGSNSGYRLALDVTNGTFQLERWDDGRFNALMPWQNSSLLKRGNQTNRVELTCVGSTIIARINGTQVAVAQDTTYLEGNSWIGTGTFPRISGTAEIYLDNLIITRSSVPPPGTTRMNDDFSGSSIDTSRWTPFLGRSGSIYQKDQRLEVNLPTGASNGGVVSACSLIGDFDVEVDFYLRRWPLNNRSAVTLNAGDLASGTFGSPAVVRWSSINEEVIWSNSHVTTVVGHDTRVQGNMRLVRSGSILRGYYGSQEVGSMSVPTKPTRIILNVGTSDGANSADVVAAFDDFRMNSGTAQCP
jgi:hypothetical protein